MTWNYNFTILLLLSSLYSINGDECYSGTQDLQRCILLTECPSAIEMIQNHQNPVLCNYNKYMPMVCCSQTQTSTIDKISDVETQKSGEIPPHPPAPLIASRIPRRSEQECSNLQKVELKSEKLNYRDAEGQKFENIINKIAEFPYMVAMGDPFAFGETVWRCGGSLISDRFVLTTASCQFSYLTDESGYFYQNRITYIVAGIALLDIYNITDLDKYILFHSIKRHIPHPLYRPNSVYHDIGLSELEPPMEFTLLVRPACLHVDQDIDPKTQLTSAGWGVEHDDDTNKKLQKFNLDLFSEVECEITFKDLSGSERLARGIVHSQQFCAAVHLQDDTRVTDTCKSNPGDALNFNINSTNGKISYIVGIKSFGDNCGLKGVPGVYTRVAAYVPWIESVVWPQSEPQISPAQPILDASGTRTAQQKPTNSTSTLTITRTSPVTQLVPSLSDRKCLYFREAELKERKLYDIPQGAGNVYYPSYGGVPAKMDEFPHMVALGFSISEKEYDIIWQCGGSLLSEKFVLTAAHCLFSNDFGNLSWAYLGKLSLNKYKAIQNPEELIYKIIRRIRHPLYKPPSTYHDIALLELERSVVFTIHVRPACLHENHLVRPEFSATGWGLTENGTYTDYLQKVVLDLYTTQECEKIYEDLIGTRRLRNGIMTDNQFCAGGRSGIQDTCKGDSGGPFQFKVSGYTGTIWHIAGVTSFGKTCGLQGVPGVYVRVSAYVPWIESVVWPDEYVPRQK